MLVEHGAVAISIPASGPTGWSRALSPERGLQRASDGWINILPYSAEAYIELFAVAPFRKLTNLNERARSVGENSCIRQSGVPDSVLVLIRSAPTSYRAASWECEFTAHQFEQGEGLFRRENLFAASPIG